jgi:hypothetical protein
MKKVIISLNEESRKFSRGEPCKGSYESSIALLKNLERDDIKIFVAHPNELYKSGNSVRANALYKLDNENKIIKCQGNNELNGNLFFTYGLGEDIENENFGIKYISEILPSMENQFELLLNTPKSTWFEIKSNQKKLSFPWIPEFKIKSTKDLEELVSEGEEIIAKPSFGYMGIGVFYINNKNSVEKFPQHLIPTYIFEKFVKSDEERRYAYLNGDLILMRSMVKKGNPGNEISSSVKILNNGIEIEKKISSELINKTEMFFGSVDFRGPYVLELNGSGTGLMPPGEHEVYNLSKLVSCEIINLLYQ